MNHYKKNEDLFDDIEKPTSQISSIFTDEVDGIGPNAQSFSLDETPQVALSDKKPEAFTLDA